MADIERLPGPRESVPEKKKTDAEIAKDRITTEHDSNIMAYHRKYLYDPSKEKEDLKNPKIFRLQLAKVSPPKGTIVLFLGNLEPLDDATVVTRQKDKGATKLMERLIADGDYNVVMVRSTQVPGPAELSANVIERHTTQIMDDMNNGRGVFQRMDIGPAVSFFGYSYGGGMVKHVIDNWGKIGGRGNVGRTAALDPVEFGSFIKPLTTRPKQTTGHLQFFQKSPGIVRGDKLSPGQKFDFRSDVNKEFKGNKSHSEMHDAKASPDIHQQIYTHLTGRPWEGGATAMK